MNFYPSLKTAVTAAAVLLLAPLSSLFAQSWTFDSNAQGWQIVDFPGTADYTTSFVTSSVTYHSTGGKSGGYVSAIDPSDGTFMFQAPSASLGNYSAYLGGNLSFSLQTDEIANWTADSVVVFRKSTGLTIIAPLTQPGASWTDYSISLVAGSFRYNNLSGGVVSSADFASVLGDLGTFLIDAEYHTGVSETTGLDSVIFAAPAAPGAVPEASTYGLAATGALLAAILLRKRRRVGQSH